MVAAVLSILGLIVVPLVVAGMSGPVDREPSQRSTPARVAALPACTIIGSGAAETLVGTNGDDVICALGGDDIVRGRGGDDVLFGSFGNDVLEGGSGDDRLKGHWGRDVLRGGRGRDRLHGGGDPDVFSGGAGPDLVDYSTRLGRVEISIGRAANDGSAGEGDAVRGDVERARGGSGDDRLVGNAKANRLYGEGGDDTLIGRRGNDRMWGGGGVDRVDGRDAERFADRLKCGAGRPDVALANAADRVAADCENGRRGAPPTPEAPAGRNRPPTNITLSDGSVAESRPIGTVVGTLDAADADAGDTHQFTLVNGDGSADNAAFVVDGTQLKTAAVFDFEAKRSYSIRVRARDERGATFQKALTIAVTDVAENATPTDVSLAPASVAENEPAGTGVGTLSAADPDAGQAHTFALVAGEGDADNAAFAVVGDQVRTGQPFDFESRSSYSIRVATTDAAGATFAKALTITVTDADDPPTAVDDAATAAEDSAAGAIDVLANDTDSDGGPKAIASASDPANGTVVLTGGSPGARTGLTYEPDADHCGPDSFTYTLNGGSTATVSITVTCVEDAPTAVDDTSTVPEDSAATPLAVLANDTDPEGDAMTIASASDPANGTVVLTGGLPGAHTGLTYRAGCELLQRDAGHVHVHAQRRLDGDRLGHRVLRRRRADGGRRQRDRGGGFGRECGRRAGQRHRRRWRSDDDRVGVGSGERRGGADGRLCGRAHGADLPARRRLLRARQLHVHAQRWLDGHRVDHRDLRRGRAGGGRRQRDRGRGLGRECDRRARERHGRRRRAEGDRVGV